MEPTPEKRPSLKASALILRSLSHRNFRLFFGGQLVSLIGTWMQQIAIGWLVYRLTDSPLLLGVVVFSGQIPTFVLAPIAGVLADRVSKHRILIITQALSMLQAAAITAIVTAGVVEVWHLIVLCALGGVFNAFDIPSRQSFFIEMIERREDLGNAIALNSSIVNSARFIGPTIAGLLIAAYGEWLCFLVNTLSYLAVLGALLAMRIKKVEKTRPKRRVWAELMEGVEYAFGYPPIRTLLILIAIVSLAGVPYATLMPVFARDVLGGGPRTLGFLMAAAGVGALSGTVYLASRVGVRGLGNIIVVATSMFGVALIIFSFSRVIWLSMPIIFFAGFGMMANMASCNTILQTIVDDSKRGRVMSFYTMAFMGTAPFGSLLSGYLASNFGAPATLVLGGSVCVLGSLFFLSRLSRIKEAHASHRPH